MRVCVCMGLCVCTHVHVWKLVNYTTINDENDNDIYPYCCNSLFLYT